MKSTLAVLGSLLGGGDPRTGPRKWFITHGDRKFPNCWLVPRTRVSKGDYLEDHPT